MHEKWALILGASSGFGAATALELSQRGFHIAGVHLDRKNTLENVERLVSRIMETGSEAFFFNGNAADPEKRKEVVGALKERIQSRDPAGTVSVFLHSLAFGTLRPFFLLDAQEAIQPRQLEMTLDVMANSLVYWVQELFWAGLLGKGSRVLAMTSAGSEKVWKTYGAVSAAKAALESYIRQIALELAPYGVTANAIRAGVTDTPALRKIPGHEVMIDKARSGNPGGRLTTPEDVAKMIVLWASPETAWVSGNVVNVDGGEYIAE